MTDEASSKANNPWWADAVKDFGLPTVFLGVLTYMIWCAGSWAATTIIMPLFTRQMEFIDQAKSTTQQMEATLSAVKSTVDAAGDHQVETLRVTAKIIDTLDANHEVVVSNSQVLEAQTQSTGEMLKTLKQIEKNTNATADHAPQ